MQPLGRPAAAAGGARPILCVLCHLQSGTILIRNAAHCVHPPCHAMHCIARFLAAATDSVTQSDSTGIFPDRPSEIPSTVEARVYSEVEMLLSGARMHTSLPKPERSGLARPRVCAPERATMSWSCICAAAQHQYLNMRVSVQAASTTCGWMC